AQERVQLLWCHDFACLACHVVTPSSLGLARLLVISISGVQVCGQHVQPVMSQAPADLQEGFRTPSPTANGSPELSPSLLIAHAV
ncbi:hypothetical protein HO924_11455, partial [Streptococcus suis]|nr:hypothetical protein [Streptococcus suis]